MPTGAEEEGRSGAEDLGVAFEVREDYVIMYDALFPRGRVKYRYAPMLSPELPGEIAKLIPEGDRSRDIQAVLRFARQYGLLGYSRVIHSIHRSTGDPLSWIWTHAYTINLCLELSELLQEGDENRLKTLFETQRLTPQERTDAQTGGFRRALVFGRADGSERFYDWDERNPLLMSPRRSITENAKALRRRIVNANIGPITRSVSNFRNEERSYVDVRSPVCAAYYHLADMIVAGKNAPVRRCNECKKRFIQTRRDQRYCPSPGEGRKESLCAVRGRMRRLRNTPRGEEGRGDYGHSSL